MRRYFLFMRDDGVDFGRLPAAERDELLRRFVEWTEALREAGRLKGVGRLEPGGHVVRGAAVAVPDASAIRPRDDGGPAAPGDPAAVGLHVIEAWDDDEATALARGCPILALGGSVEVREVRASLR